jgi:hypothetical protein
MNVGILILAIMDMLVGFLLLGILRPLLQRKIGRNGLYGDSQDTKNACLG